MCVYMCECVYVFVCDILKFPRPYLQLDVRGSVDLCTNVQLFLSLGWLRYV
jgi:hypothetical protein